MRAPQVSKRDGGRWQSRPAVEYRTKNVESPGANLRRVSGLLCAESRTRGRVPPLIYRLMGYIEYARGEGARGTREEQYGGV
jgi:hypothetical protein